VDILTSLNDFIDKLSIYFHFLLKILRFFIIIG